MSDYTYPDTSTPKNKFGITDFEELERVEAAYVEARRIEIEDGYGPQGNFDTEHLKAIHQHLFQDVYEWAGHTRDERVMLSDGTTASEPIMRKAEGQPFAIGPEIPAALDAFAERLRWADYFKGLPRDEFAARAADALVELNSIHPFREGNGRTQRVIIEQLAETAGHTLDFTVVSKERMAQASIEAHEGNDPLMMRRMFDEISDPERTAILRESIASLEKLNFPWNDRYIATIAPGHTVELVLAGVSRDQFMARTESQILFGDIAHLPQPHPERGQKFTVAAPARQQDKAQPARNVERDLPLSPNDVLNRFGNPDLEARYEKQEYTREQQTKSASSTPSTPGSMASRGNVPTEKKAEVEAQEKNATFKQITRETDRAKDRDHDRDGGRGGGRGGRGSR